MLASAASVDDLFARLEAEGFALSPDPWRGWGPARHMRAKDRDGREGLVGFIGAMTENFCDSCNRVRVGADGSLRACLGGRDRVGLKELLRGGASDEELAATIRAALLGKGERHAMKDAAGSLLPMIGSGG